MAELRLRGFISYSTEDRKVAGKLKVALAAIGIDCFLAHDDLGVSEEWKSRILDELRHADVFIALLSGAFLASKWAPQEVGFAVSRSDVLIVPLSLDGTVPFGFISHLQGRPLSDPVVESQFLPPLTKRFPRHVIPLLISRLASAASFRGAEALMEPLVPLFDAFTDPEIEAFAGACIRNGQIWDASLCAVDYIPAFIERHRSRIPPKTLKALEYQIGERQWFVGPEA